jgi:hypothetical protein
MPQEESNLSTIILEVKRWAEIIVKTAEHILESEEKPKNED